MVTNNDNYTPLKPCSGNRSKPVWPWRVHFPPGSCRSTWTISVCVRAFTLLWLSIQRILSPQQGGQGIHPFLFVYVVFVQQKCIQNQLSLSVSAAGTLIHSLMVQDKALLITLFQTFSFFLQIF